MASDKNRPPDNDFPAFHEQVAVEQEQDPTAHQTQFSTHPPPHRENISGSFRLSLSGDHQLQKAYALFEKRSELKKEITNPNFGGMLLREFHLFHELPNRVKNNIQTSLLQYLQEKIIPYQDPDDDQKKHQLPTPPQVNQEIIRQVLERNQIQTIKDEVQTLLAFNHEFDDKTAEKILHAIIEWLEHYEVQIYAQKSGTNTGGIKAELQRLFVRLKTRRVIESELSAPHSPSSTPPPEPKKGEKDRS